jgi:hypothetical protein
MRVRLLKDRGTLFANHLLMETETKKGAQGRVRRAGRSRTVPTVPSRSGCHVVSMRTK